MCTARLKYVATNRHECSPLYVINFLEDMYALPALLSSNCLPLLSPFKHFLLDTPMLVNKQNKTALDLAVENTYESIIKLLELASVNSACTTKFTHQ